MPNEKHFHTRPFQRNEKYKLTVEEGTGSGEYEAGEKFQ